MRPTRQVYRWTTAVAACLLWASALAAQDGARIRTALGAKSGEWRILFETFRDDNWEIFSVNPDGSDPKNLTHTPGIHELYPHGSPDGSQICFSADEGEGAGKTRNVYVMDADGKNRVKVAENARQACWSPDGSKIAYLGGEFEEFSYLDYATQWIYVYDVEKGTRRKHPNDLLYHLYNICWSPDSNWFIATVHGGMGFKHAILAIEAEGKGVFDLKIPGCRPEFSPDGNQVSWGMSDWQMGLADVDYSGPHPKLVDHKILLKSKDPMKIYHVDWSPDGKLFAFSRGPNKKSLGLAPEIVGVRAPGWNLCVSDGAVPETWVEITTDGLCNKEPDWIRIAP